MTHEITKEFRFEAAHTLIREIAADGSRRIHGHSYRAEIALRGKVDGASGMVLDLALVERRLAVVRDALDHRFLDEIEGLGPATMENLSTWIWRLLKPEFPQLVRVMVARDSIGETCSYRGE